MKSRHPLVITRTLFEPSQLDEVVIRRDGRGHVMISFNAEGMMKISQLVDHVLDTNSEIIEGKEDE